MKQFVMARGGRLGHHLGGAGPAGAQALYVNSNCHVSFVSYRRQAMADLICVQSASIGGRLNLCLIGVNRWLAQRARKVMMPRCGS